MGSALTAEGQASVLDWIRGSLIAGGWRCRGGASPIAVEYPGSGAALCEFADAALFTSDLERALWAGDRLDTGTVGISQCLVSTAAAPFSGTKQSGVGKEGCPEWVDEYLTRKYLPVAFPRVPAGMEMEGGSRP
jgi:Aldehyde dehydrogenase family